MLLLSVDGFADMIWIFETSIFWIVIYGFRMNVYCDTSRNWILIRIISDTWNIILFDWYWMFNYFLICTQDIRCCSTYHKTTAIFILPRTTAVFYFSQDNSDLILLHKQRLCSSSPQRKAVLNFLSESCYFYFFADNGCICLSPDQNCF